jgi:hypothetical protein
MIPAVVAGIYNFNYLGCMGRRSRPVLGKNSRPTYKINKAKRAGGVAQLVECLPSKYKIRLSTYRKKKREVTKCSPHSKGSWNK